MQHPGLSTTLLPNKSIEPYSFKGPENVKITTLCLRTERLLRPPHDTTTVVDYREILKKIRTEMKVAKETWIQGQCPEVEACLRKYNSKKTNQLVDDLITEKQGKSTSIQDKSGKCLREEHEILSRWTEYCSDLYNYESDRDPTVLDCPQIQGEEHHSILREKQSKH